MATSELNVSDSLESHLLCNLQAAKATSNLLVAFSGGIDSKVLLHILAGLRNKKQIQQLAAIHINHNLQKPADDWQRQCEQDCQHLQIPLQIKKLQLVNRPNKNIEAVAREARYQVFSQLLEKHHWLVMAHHQDDQAETLLFRLLRGSGLQGAAAMPQTRALGEGKLLRPMLDITREQIEAYAVANKLCWIEDPSNQNTDFSRNFLRHKVLPLIKQKWPGYSTTFSRFADLACEQTQLLEALADEDLAKVIDNQQAIRLADLQQLPDVRKKNLLHFWGKKNAEHSPASEEIATLLAQLHAAQSKSIEVKFAGRLARSYAGNLLLTALKQPKTIEKKIPWQQMDIPLTLSNGLSIKFCATQNQQQICLRKPRQDESVWVDARRGGEVCQPDYRNKATDLKTIYQELKVPHWQRKWLPIIYYDQAIVAVPGVFVCKDFIADQSVDKQAGELMIVSQ